MIDILIDTIDTRDDLLIGRIDNLLIDTIENPFCQIYIDTAMKLDELAETISYLTEGRLDYSTITTVNSQILVMENDDYNPILRSEFPGGFVYFRYYLEVDAFPNLQRQEYIAHIAYILEHFWSHGFPAVALCDFEEELPNRGGFKSCEVPWLAPKVPLTIPAALTAVS
jgi:hypothetical protein